MDRLNNEETIRSIAIEEGNYRVAIASDENGNWILCAFDYVTQKKEKLNKKDASAKGTPGKPNVEAGAVTSNLSDSKDSTVNPDSQAKSEETPIGNSKYSDKGYDEWTRQIVYENRG